jgi:predicted dehydrogenase
MPMNLESLPSNSRLKDASLGAGVLLDMGIYSLTYGLLILDPEVGSNAAEPHIQSNLGLIDGIDHTASILLSYPNTRKIGVLSAAVNAKTDEQFCRIEGSKGVIKILGFAASNPKVLVISKPGEPDAIQEYVKRGMGFYYEADAVACDIAAGKKQNEIMPWSESLRTLRLMDMIRRENGLRYPQDA